MVAPDRISIPSILSIDILSSEALAARFSYTIDEVAPITTITYIVKASTITATNALLAVRQVTSETPLVIFILYIAPSESIIITPLLV